MYVCVISPLALGVCSGGYISILYLHQPWHRQWWLYQHIIHVSLSVLAPAVVAISAYRTGISLSPGTGSGGYISILLYMYLLSPGTGSGGLISISYLSQPRVCVKWQWCGYTTTLSTVGYFMYRGIIMMHVIINTWMRVIVVGLLS